METATRPTTDFDKHAQQCEHCSDVMKEFPDLNLFNHQLCPVGRTLFGVPQETPAQQELLPCPLLGHEPLGTSDSFGPGPYVSVSGRPNFLQFYSVICPGCCSTASYEHRENAIKAWNTRYRDPAFQKLVEAANEVPDPEDEGFCDSCGTGNQLELKKEVITTKEGASYDRYYWQHLPHCWYGNLREALRLAREGEE